MDISRRQLIFILLVVYILIPSRESFEVPKSTLEKQLKAIADNQGVEVLDPSSWSEEKRDARVAELKHEEREASLSVFDAVDGNLLNLKIAVEDAEEALEKIRKELKTAEEHAEGLVLTSDRERMIRTFEMDQLLEMEFS